MERRRQDEVEDLLLRLRGGDRMALKDLIPLVQKELRLVARRQLRHERPHHTLETTALVNEAYLRLTEQKSMQWNDRAHFLAVAAEIIRRVLVDHARARKARKRGGQALRVHIGSEQFIFDSRRAGVDLLALNDALDRLDEFDRRLSRLVVCRFFSGLSFEETAEALGVSLSTVKRDWDLAKSWLYKELNED